MDAFTAPLTTAPASRDTGQAIALARKARRLTQHELARRAAISVSLLRKIEQGRRPLTPGIRAALTAVLGTIPAGHHAEPAPGRITVALPLLRDVMDCYDIPAGLRRPAAARTPPRDRHGDRMAARLPVRRARRPATRPAVRTHHRGAHRHRPRAGTGLRAPRARLPRR